MVADRVTKWLTANLSQWLPDIPLPQDVGIRSNRYLNQSTQTEEKSRQSVIIIIIKSVESYECIGSSCHG